MVQGNIKYVYPGGNTAQGFYSFYRSGLQGMEHIFILKGGPGTGKSTLMRKIGLAMMDRGFNVEFWQCSSDNDSLDGVLIPALKAAVVDGTAPHIVDPKYPGVVDQIINLGDCWNEEVLQANGNEIKDLADRISSCFSTAYQYLKAAKAVHDDWEAINNAALDVKKANQLAEELVEEIFQSNKPLVRHLFAGAITPKGMLNFIDNITGDCRSRYIIKGLPGTGKSTLTKKVMQAAMNRGYQMDVYHCSFDPDSIDMLVIPALSLAVIDGTPPHEIDPQRPGDKIIDMLDCLDLEEVNKKADKMADMETEFQHLTGEAVKNLAQAKKLHDELEGFYIKAMDFEAINKKRTKIFNKILLLAAEKEK
ncbi:MAG: PRK06851 family protein [Desulfitobacteriaceae bacterium]|nr:PRK06851 family protein [Desulfitobacteriaceae bacterium]